MYNKKLSNKIQNYKIIKKILLITLFFILISPFITQAVIKKCKPEYLKKITECRNAIKTGSYKSLDFLCIQDKKDSQVFQIILDLEFKKIDADAKNGLYFLEKNKDYYFKTAKQGSKVPNFLDAIDKIDEDFGINGKYYFRYLNICNNYLVENLAACEPTNYSQVLKNAYTEDCLRLAKTKLNIYKNVAYNTLLLNKLQLRKDNRTTFMQNTRQSYTYLLKLFDINIGYLERIAFKWKVKIKNPYLP